MCSAYPIAITMERLLPGGGDEQDYSTTVMSPAQLRRTLGGMLDEFYVSEVPGVTLQEDQE